MHRVRLVVREDLGPGQQASQLSHAMAQLWAEFPEPMRVWYANRNTVVLLAVPNERALHLLARKAGLGCRVREPDLDHSLTALGLVPSDTARRACKGLRLALQGWSRAVGDPT